jgi:hypothetical protein
MPFEGEGLLKARAQIGGSVERLVALAPAEGRRGSRERHEMGLNEYKKRSSASFETERERGRDCSSECEREKGSRTGLGFFPSKLGERLERFRVGERGGNKGESHVWGIDACREKERRGQVERDREREKRYGAFNAEREGFSMTISIRSSV